jgi:DNA-binding GntR family transcriptional regulator
MSKKNVVPPPETPDTGPTTLASQVHERIRADIIRGDLKPGLKLKIAETAARYEVGAIPVREALSRLAMSGFVEIKDQRGFYVRAVSSAELLDLTRVQILVESAALRESIDCGDGDWEGRVIGSLHALSCLTPFDKDGQRKLDMQWERAHNEFHRQLLSACRSPHLLGMASDLRDQTTRYRHISVGSTVTTQRNVAGEHEAIAQAVIARKTELAVALLNDHTVTSSGIALKEFGASATAPLRLEGAWLHLA